MSQGITRGYRMMLTAICLVFVGVGLFLAFRPKEPVARQSETHIEQSTKGDKSPAIITGRDSKLTINGKEAKKESNTPARSEKRR